MICLKIMEFNPLSELQRQTLYLANVSHKMVVMNERDEAERIISGLLDRRDPTVHISCGVHPLKKN